MQSPLPLEPDENPQQPRPELVTAVAVPPPVPEQLPLLRLLEVVHARVESIHTGQRSLAAEVRDIRVNLPVQRRPLSKRAQQIHIAATWSRRNGLCACCQTTPVCLESGRLNGAEYDHWFGRNQARVTQTWLICRDCNQRLTDTDFKSGARSAFESYQQALPPFLGGRQVPLGLKMVS
jgi:hypothetical protein